MKHSEENEDGSDTQASHAARWSIIGLALVLLLIAADAILRDLPVRRMRQAVAAIRPGDDWATAEAKLIAAGYKVRSDVHPGFSLHSISSGRRSSYIRRLVERGYSATYKGSSPPPGFMVGPQVFSNTSGTVTKVDPHL